MSVSPNGATFRTDKAIIDDHSQAWTISTDGLGLVLANGQHAGNSSDAANLLWYGKVLYHENTSNNWYGWDNTKKAWYPSKDPRAVVTPSPSPVAIPKTKMFYGINGHWDFPFNPSGLIGVMHDVGLTSFRLATENSSQSIDSVVAWAKALQGSGITLVVCINCSFTDANDAYWGSEEAAYSYAKAQASSIVQALSPYGVTIFELGNEYTRRPETVFNSAMMGTQLSVFKQDYWPQMRGLIRGMHDGVKSVNAKALTAACFCVADIAASDALWNGNEPNGATGKNKVRWDITSWHNYEVYGDIFNIGKDGGGPAFDLVDYCDKAYGVPFMVTEWGGLPEQTDAEQASYYTQALTKYYANRSRGHGIMAVMVYQMLGSWGITNDSYAKDFSARYAALKNFIKTHAE